MRSCIDHEIYLIRRGMADNADIITHVLAMKIIRGLGGILGPWRNRIGVSKTTGLKNVIRAVVDAWTEGKGT